MNQVADCRQLTNSALTEGLNRAVAKEREDLNAVLTHLAEFDRRDLATREHAFPSLLAYCTSKLGYSEGAAARRIYAARAVAKYPVILSVLATGAIHLDAVARLGPHMTPENHLDLLERAKGRSRLEIQFLVAALKPKTDVADTVRIVAAPPPDGAAQPESAPDASPAASSTQDPSGSALFSGPIPSSRQETPSPWNRLAAPELIEPRSSTRVRFTFTASAALLGLLERARQLLRHKYPGGRLEDVFGDALETLLDKKDPDRRLARLERSGRRPPDPAACDPDSRRIPQAVRDAVWRRDAGQCAHVEPGGERCPERGGLEFDHIVPHALGGASNDAKNIRLLCRGHNRASAIRLFGEGMTRHWTRPPA